MRRTKSEALQTKNAILDAAERVFLKRGVVRTSLQEVAEAAHVTRGAVYWHFRNKIELVRAMVDRVILPQEHILEQLEKSQSKTPLEDLSRTCKESLREMIHNDSRRRVFTILTQRCEYVDELSEIIKTLNKLRNRIQTRFTRLFERAHKYAQLSPAWTPRTAAITLHSLLFGLIHNVIIDSPSSPAAAEKAITASLTAFFKTLRA
jgi:AcrR family transcriptional regulator